MRASGDVVKVKGKPSALGARVRRRRKALGLTAEALAKAVGVSTSYISQLERGFQREPSLPTARRLAEALATDLPALLGAPGGMAGPGGIPDTLHDAAAAYHLPAEAVRMLAAVHLDGRQPSSSEDWLFLWLAIRRACHLLDAPQT